MFNMSVIKGSFTPQYTIYSYTVLTRRITHRSGCRGEASPTIEFCERSISGEEEGLYYYHYCLFKINCFYEFVKTNI